MTNVNLTQYKDIRKELIHIEEQLQRLEYVMTSPRTSIITDMPMSPSRNGDKMTDDLIKLENLRNKYKELSVNLYAKQLEVEETIENLEPIERDLIRYRYFDGLSWQEIQEKLCLSRRTSYRIHKKAIGKICTDK